MDRRIAWYQNWPVTKAFPGHKGRPGLQGGSLPRVGALLKNLVEQGRAVQPEMKTAPEWDDMEDLAPIAISDGDTTAKEALGIDYLYRLMDEEWINKAVASGMEQYAGEFTAPRLAICLTTDPREAIGGFYGSDGVIVDAALVGRFVAWNYEAEVRAYQPIPAQGIVGVIRDGKPYKLTPSREEIDWKGSLPGREEDGSEYEWVPE